MRNKYAAVIMAIISAQMRSNMMYFLISSIILMLTYSFYKRQLRLPANRFLFIFD